jgi:hypothetical protein
MITKSKVKNVQNFVVFGVLGAMGGGLVGVILLVLRVFNEPITEVLCALAGALVLPLIVKVIAKQKGETAEKLDAEHRAKIAMEKSHYIAATCMTSFDPETRELSFTDLDFKAYIDGNRQPNGTICRSGEVIELWSYTAGSPLAEVHSQITRGRSARWLGSFNDKQVVAIIEDWTDED